MELETQSSESRLSLSFEDVNKEYMASGLVEFLKREHPDLPDLSHLFKMSFEELADFFVPLMAGSSGATVKALRLTINSNRQAL